jgi:hypothetical protein
MDAPHPDPGAWGFGLRRRFTLVLALGVVLAIVAASVSLADSSDSGPPPPMPPPPPDQQQASGDGSTSGYPNASDQHAENLFASDFSSAVKALAQDPVDLSGEHPTYLDDHTAVISPAVTGPDDLQQQVEAILRGDQGDVQATSDDLNALQQLASGTTDNPPMVVSSTTPLRVASDSGHKAPVDLTLDQEGSSYVPQNPLVDLSLPDNLNQDIGFGDQGIKIDLGATTSATADPINGGQNLFYADAARATDIVLAPLSGCLETLYELRAPESPDHFTMSFSLPAGADLQAADGGGAKIVEGGNTLAGVLPPAATDASGAQVPLTSTVEGDSLRIEIPHSDPSIQYPISIDPTEYYAWYNPATGVNSTTGLSEWSPYSQDSGYQLFSGCVYICGLYVTAGANSYIGNGHVAGYYQLVPHYSASSTAYISNFSLYPIYYSTGNNATTYPELWAGLYSPSTGIASGRTQSTAGGPILWSSAGSLGTAGQEAFFYLAGNSTPHLGYGHQAVLGGGSVALSDTDRPNFTSHDVGGGLQVSQLVRNGSNVTNWAVSNWVDTTTSPATLNTSATDGGLGIASFLLPTSTSGQLTTRTEASNCDGTTSKQCPLSAAEQTSFNVTSSWPNGPNVSGVEAVDATGQFDWRDWEIRVDHSPPQISTSGGLTNQITGPGPSIHVGATDGTATNYTSPGSQWQSGVKSIELDLNGTQVANTGDHACTAEWGSCPLSLDYTANPASYSGLVHVTVKVTDELNHVQTQQWDTTVDTSGPQLQVSGPLVDTSNPSVGQDSGLSVSASDTASGATSIELDVDGQQVDSISQGCASGGCSLQGSLDADLTDFGSGSHNYQVVATDAVGNTTVRSGSFNLDSSPPQLSVTGALPDSDNGPLPGPTADATISATDNAAGDLGISRFEVTVDDQTAATANVTCSPSCPATASTTFTYRQRDWGPGPHDLSIIATDAAGNVSEQDFQVDEPPSADTVSAADCPQPPPAPTSQPEPDPMTASQVQTSVQASVASSIAPSAPATDQQTAETLDPSLLQPDTSSGQLELTGSLAQGDLSSLAVGGFELDQLICMMPGQTTTSESGANVVNGDSAVYANTAPDADTVVRPSATGATVIENLRGSAAPQSFSWQVGVPAGFQLVQASDGTIAAINPNEPAPAGLSVPPPPANEQNPQAIPDVATQLAVEQYEVAKAEQDTGRAVYSVVTPPYTVDAQGNSHPASLSLSGSETVVASGAQGATALVMSVSNNSDKTGAPNPVPAWHIVANSIDDAKGSVILDAYKFATGGQPTSEHRIRDMVLDLGGGLVVNPGGPYGAELDGNFPAKMKEIRSHILQAAARTYADNRNGGRVRIAFGLNNNLRPDSLSISDASNLGDAQARSAHWLASFERGQGSNFKGERAAPAGDIETSTSWSGPNLTLPFVDGAKQRWGAGYLDYGNAKQCAQNDPNCQHGWTVSQVAHAARGSNGRAIPYVYSHDEVDDWAHVKNAWDQGSPFTFTGVTGSTEYGVGPYCSPGYAWRALRGRVHKKPGDFGNELLNYKQDTNNRSC